MGGPVVVHSFPDSDKSSSLILACEKLDWFHSPATFISIAEPFPMGCVSHTITIPSPGVVKPMYDSTHADFCHTEHPS